jgi:hypothetical protein
MVGGFRGKGPLYFLYTGTRSVGELVAQLSSDLRDGRIVLPDLKPATPAQHVVQVTANVQRCLRLFAQQGILALGS